jgi:hypothetical protein
MRALSPLSWIAALLALAALPVACEHMLPLAAHGHATAWAPDETGQMLHGTWLREFSTGAVRARRVLQLAADGGFRETVRATAASGESTEQIHEGTWLYDGTNLKRKYTLMNGSPPSRLNLPFATFQIAFESRNEFVGTDHIRGNRIRYRRVADGTQP